MGRIARSDRYHTTADVPATKQLSPPRSPWTWPVATPAFFLPLPLRISSPTHTMSARRGSHPSSATQTSTEIRGRLIGAALRELDETDGYIKALRKVSFFCEILNGDRMKEWMVIAHAGGSMDNIEALISATKRKAEDLLRANVSVLAIKEFLDLPGHPSGQEDSLLTKLVCEQTVGESTVFAVCAS